MAITILLVTVCYDVRAVEFVKFSNQRLRWASMSYKDASKAYPVTDKVRGYMIGYKIINMSLTSTCRYMTARTFVENIFEPERRHTARGAITDKHLITLFNFRFCTLILVFIAAERHQQTYRSRPVSFWSSDCFYRHSTTFLSTEYLHFSVETRRHDRWSFFT